MSYTMLRTAALAGMMLMVYSCSFQSDHPDIFKLEGNIEGASGKMIYMNLTGEGQTQDIDSAIISDDGSFAFQRKLAGPDIFVMYLDKSNFTYLLLEPGEDIQVEAHAESLDKSLSCEGSPGTAYLIEVKQRNRDLSEMLDSLKLVLKGVEPEAYQSALQEAQQQADEAVVRFAQYLKKSIDDQPASLASIAALHQRVGNKKILSFEENRDLFHRVDSTLFALYPNNYHVREFHKACTKLELEYKQQQTKAIELKEGTLAPDIKFPTPGGDSIALSSLRGNYVLLDFWASWCKPCREENPHLVAAYAAFHSKGFEIYSVSLDKQKDKWLEAIAADKLSWPYHVSDLKYWESEPARLYNVSSIPASFLIDPQGVIIAKDLRGDALHKKLESLLAK